MTFSGNTAASGEAESCSSGRQSYIFFAQVVEAAQMPQGPGSWDALAVRAQRGDLTAREALYGAMAPWMAHLALGSLQRARAAPSGWLEADDVHQQIFVIFCALLASWDPARVPFGGYVGVLLPYRVGNYVRTICQRGARMAGGDATEYLAMRVAAPGSDPAVAYPVREFSAALEVALRALDADTRAVFVQHVIEERPVAEIAAALEISERTVWRWLRLARAMLAARLGQESSGSE